MKNQYFCDISDYYKYGLLRLITKHTSLNVGVCWMLTKDDGKKNDKRKQYLYQPDRWQHYDPKLFELSEEHCCAARYAGNLPSAIPKWGSKAPRIAERTAFTKASSFP